MVSVDGVRRLLKLNQPSPEGLRLISATSKEAVIELNGEHQTYPLGGHITTRFSKPEQLTAKVWRDQAGAYTTVGTINGLTVNFLVDTGATAVAMHANQAKRLGISYRLEGNPIYVSTANGTTPAYDVTLDRVQVGDITLRNIRGFVIDSNGPGRVLLGMSFLNRVKMEDQGSVLVLEQRF
ncbi:MAG: TIGR02281 family clan AA aspartic protease [Candidatus Thiodiazotropha sp. (ex Lucinoma borealis)]|nr:TIGR02281 family clan AA aspartic protease [Candidatus Thiodiazotropha sp. (ex Lucinoma borealis)]MCU7841082.1 TIGR02281 family clan AA aspartic protease [Candidatus Thiodiazotropha sp. (ex Troendleina suluensis)]MCU7856735.1 TIGR02281 family clan AA aspartic protease [Candidatus Thiodiazotropha sp. (ex Lucinoma borealis)]MCU7866357.1 TIGR02281 family clan AA aspartic protease [Candidatus Thiodiazotropha sp. (ex Lucinoma borealis)]MCU7870052.1 TIGR02281 family clan AA aspartic protease [Cand